MRTSRRWLCGLVVAALVALSAAAGADEPPADKEELAHELYVEGMRLYNLGNYDEAIEKYEQGYRLVPLPGFLYNLAQAYRFKGECAKAYRLYRNFLRLAEQVEHRAEIEGLMAEMDECQKREVDQRPPEPQLGDPTGAQLDEPTEAQPDASPDVVAIDQGGGPPSRPRRARLEKLGGIVTASLGLVFVGTGAYFAVDASNASGDISELFAQGGDWSDEYDDIQARGQRSSTLSTVFFATGAVAVVGGAVLYYLGVRDAKVGGASLVVDPTPSSPSVMWLWEL